MELNLNELERLANAATPGPWSWTSNEGWSYPQTQVKTEQGTKIARFVDAAPQFCCTVGEARQEWKNAAFIAAANPAVVLDLVRRLRACTSALEVARAHIREDRATLFDCHLDPVTCRVDDELGAEALATYDRVLKAIDEAIEPRKMNLDTRSAP